MSGPGDALYDQELPLSPFGEFPGTVSQVPIAYALPTQPEPAHHEPPNPFLSEHDGKLDWISFWKKIADGPIMNIMYRSALDGEMMVRTHRTIAWNTIQRWKNIMPMYIGNLHRQANKIFEQYPIHEEPSTPKSFRRTVSSGLQMLKQHDSESTSLRSASTHLERAGSSHLTSPATPATPATPTSPMSTSPGLPGQGLTRASDAVRALQILKDNVLFQRIIVQSWRLRDIWSESAHPSHVRMDPPMPYRWLKALDNRTTLKRFFTPEEADLIAVKLVQLHGHLTTDYYDYDIHGNPLHKKRKTDKGKGSAGGRDGRKGRKGRKGKKKETGQPVPGSSRG